MKNQNDLIFSIVFGVLGLVAFGIALATKPEPQPIAAPPTITTSDAALPTASVSYGATLPAASGNAGGGMGGGRMGGGYPGGGGGYPGRPGGSMGGYPGGGGGYPGGGGSYPGGGKMGGRPSMSGG